MLQPVRTKWRKAHKGRIQEQPHAQFYQLWCLCFRALTPDRVTGKQIEAARVS